jgi:formate transporter
MASTSGVPDTSGLSWGSFLTDNLLPVTIGNVIGGGLLVGLVYWFVYLRRRTDDGTRGTTEPKPQPR